MKGFLSGRRARVRVNSTYSRWHAFKEGVPQGSVLAPLLFLFVIDCLRARLPRGVFVSLFADDLALWAGSPDKDEARSKVELAVHEVAKWSREKKLELNISKCLVSFFSADTHDARWQPRVVVEGEVLGFDPTPTFLGVTYDRQLTFAAHAQKAASKLAKGSQVMMALAGSDWGWSQDLLSRVYNMCILSKAN